MESIDRSSNRPWEFCSIKAFTTDLATHNHTLQIHIPSRFPGEWAHLAHVSMMKYHILYFTPTPESSKLYMITLSIKFFQWCSRSDWPPYEVAASESGSYLIMASIFFWLLQWECYIMALCMTVITWSTFGKHENSSLLKNFVSTSWKSILKLGNLRIFSRISQK